MRLRKKMTPDEAAALVASAAAKRAEWAVETANQVLDCARFAVEDAVFDAKLAKSKAEAAKAKVEDNAKAKAAADNDDSSDSSSISI